VYDNVLQLFSSADEQIKTAAAFAAGECSTSTLEHDFFQLTSLGGLRQHRCRQYGKVSAAYRQTGCLGFYTCWSTLVSSCTTRGGYNSSLAFTIDLMHRVTRQSFTVMLLISRRSRKRFGNRSWVKIAKVKMTALETSRQLVSASLRPLALPSISQSFM
jgi:hypothetical protein